MTAAIALPPGACDCHVHVFGPAADYPFAPGRIYTPPDASPDAYLAVRRRLGFERVVLVQPSVYGTDNSRHLAALSQIPNARGVAVISGEEPDAELAHLDAAGFCGVRINLKQGIGRESLESALDRLGPRLGELGWHLQINADPAAIADAETTLAAAPVPVIFDHYAGLSVWVGPGQPGFDAVRRLLRGGNAWIKLSAPYNHPCENREAGSANAGRLVAALVEAAADRLVWASNWPHPGFVPPTTGSDAPIAPFREVDDAEMLTLFLDWAGDDAMARRILCDNPAAFYRF